MAISFRLAGAYCFGALASNLACAEPSIDFSLALQERATYQSAVVFDEDDPDVGWFWTQRITGTGDIRLSPSVSATVSVVSAASGGVSISPVERNLLDAQQAFVAWQLGESEVRVGRQEIALGSQRLVGVRQGTNVRRTWDGIRWRRPRSDWSLDAFALQLVSVAANGAFNDDSNENRRLLGIYAKRTVDESELDVYYMLSRVNDRTTVQGTADQSRHSVGARWAGNHKAWFWNWEAVAQFGEQGDDEIRAWTLATNTGYRFAGAWSPEIMLSANIASGDTDPADATLETFDALYPRGSYFSEAAILGPSNFYNINPYLRFTPREDFTVSVDVNWYWRLERSDGVYAPNGALLRPNIASSSKAVSRAVSLSMDWAITPRWSLGVVATHADPLSTFESTGRSDPVQFLEITLSANFF